MEARSANTPAVWARPLTLNMFNSFKDDKICIHIPYHILDFDQQKKTKFTGSNPICCLPYTTNTMPADALAT